MPYLAPTNLEDALGFLEETDPVIIAGGTDYFPGLQQGEVHDNLLDLSRIDGLRGITRTERGWRIGAVTTWTDIVRTSLPPAFNALKLAAREVGALQIQNQGTVAGNICNASPAADGVPPLLILDAVIEVGSVTGRRMIALSDFIQGVRKTSLNRGEIVLAIHIPDISDKAASTFAKLGARKHLVISIAMVSACIQVDAGTLRDVRIAVGSCSPVATRLPELEKRLTGQPVTDLSGFNFGAEQSYAPLSPISDVRGTASYRLDVVAEMCGRAVLEACKGS